MLRMCGIVLLTVQLAGCQGFAEVAYDHFAGKEAERCDAMMSQPDRAACLSRARAVDAAASRAREAK